MQKLCKDILWLLSGGVNDTIRERNELKTQITATRADLQKSLARINVLEESLRHAKQSLRLPLIMLNTLPKSGSIFLVESLRTGLNIPVKRVSAGYFPMDLADYRPLADAAEGNAVSQAHLDANPTNLQLLSDYSRRVVLHLRDPRQALLSWIHHVHGYANIGQLRESMVTPVPPVSLFQSGLSAEIDWHLAHHFGNLLNWMERWLEHAESGNSPTLLISHFHDLRANPQTAIERILDFYGIPRQAYTPKDIPRTRETHFRKGELDEWREVFNSTQKQICADLMKGYPRVNRLYGELPSQTTENLQQPETLHISATNNGSPPHASVQKIESAVTASPR
ncbi:MAG TPA: sulfotransferase domain-containing protein [Opitutales bacterium]|jgi:hypothetical protein|nr:sulfotransferase domain-containing protein [Opitutales bacterium]